MSSPKIPMIAKDMEDFLMGSTYLKGLAKSHPHPTTPQEWLSVIGLLKREIAKRGHPDIHPLSREMSIRYFLTTMEKLEKYSTERLWRYAYRYPEATYEDYEKEYKAMDPQVFLDEAYDTAMTVLENGGEIETELLSDVKAVLNSKVQETKSLLEDYSNEIQDHQRSLSIIKSPLLTDHVNRVIEDKKDKVFKLELVLESLGGALERAEEAISPVVQSEIKMEE